MIDPRWVFLGAALGAAGSARYCIAIVHGRASPNLVTWILWAVAGLTAFLAQLDSGVGLPAALTLAAGLGPVAVVTTAMLSGRSRLQVDRLDVACGLTAVLALVAWLVLDRAPVAVALAVAADAVAAAPTIRKVWNAPRSESTLFYVLVGTGAVIALLTIDAWEPAAWVFPAYIVVLCGTIAMIATVRSDVLRGSRVRA
ncbi:hypothetical protein [Pseudonocardia parietis]|uniref:Uncharacterized protein n=1 Tax=Pseudonocardia parietis TaxID=570936 RepID=A0ABS4W0L1_9PSEU|nr:hypothetical protein [Pseudonocardia parietis]MBP2369711.1 hypothetical protein [Pseudonocardia parietis]